MWVLSDDGRGGVERRWIEQPRLGVRWLAAALGVSRERASKLLRQGRIRGAVRCENGAWNLDQVHAEMQCQGLRVPRVNAGRRGPPLKAARQKGGAVR